MRSATLQMKETISPWLAMSSSSSKPGRNARCVVRLCLTVCESVCPGLLLLEQHFLEFVVGWHFAQIDQACQNFGESTADGANVSSYLLLAHFSAMNDLGPHAIEVLHLFIN